MIIDFHAHIGESEFLRHHYGLKDYRRLMRQEGIAEAVVMPNISKRTQPRDMNHTLREEIKSVNTDDCHMLILVPGTDKDDWAKPVVGVKFHPSIMRITTTDPSMQVYWECCERMNLFVLVHCGRNRASHIGHLILTAKKWPRVRFIGAHLGGNATDLVEKAVDLLAKERLDNVWLDTSAAKVPYLIALAVNRLGADRVLFGSDVPYADLRISKSCVELAPLTDGQREAVFYGNARAMLGKR